MSDVLSSQTIITEVLNLRDQIRQKDEQIQRLMVENKELKKDIESTKEKLDQEMEIRGRFEALLQFRELIEDYESHFTVLIPDALNPFIVDQNYHSVFQNRVMRWQWILTKCKDKRAEFLGSHLRAASLPGVNLVDMFATVVSVIFYALSTKIHFPGAQQTYGPDQVIASMQWFGILNENDSWIKDTIRILIGGFSCIPSPFQDTRDMLANIAASSATASSATSYSPEEPKSKRFKSS